MLKNKLYLISVAAGLMLAGNSYAGHISHELNARIQASSPSEKYRLL